MYLPQLVPVQVSVSSIGCWTQEPTLLQNLVLVCIPGPQETPQAQPLHTPH